MRSTDIDPKDVYALKDYTSDSTLSVQRLKGTNRYLVKGPIQVRCIWPRVNKCAEIIDGILQDEYRLEPKVYYRIHIAKTLDLPRNMGKFWTESDLSSLDEMCSSNMSIKQIAHELERHPTNIAEKVERHMEVLLDIRHDDNSIVDIGISDLLRVVDREDKIRHRNTGSECVGNTE